MLCLWSRLQWNLELYIEIRAAFHSARFFFSVSGSSNNISCVTIIFDLWIKMQHNAAIYLNRNQLTQNATRCVSCPTRINSDLWRNESRTLYCPQQTLQIIIIISDEFKEASSWVRANKDDAIIYSTTNHQNNTLMIDEHFGQSRRRIIEFERNFRQNKEKIIINVLSLRKWFVWGIKNNQNLIKSRRVLKLKTNTLNAFQFYGKCLTMPA